MMALSSTVFAQEKLEGDGSSGFDVYLEIAGATFLGKNSYFGESEDFIGANTDNWTEGAFELGIRGETPAGKGTFFGDISGLVTGIQLPLRRFRW